MYNKRIKKLFLIVLTSLILISCLIFHTTDINASVTTGWNQIGPTIYLFNNRVKVTGWSKSGNSLYYFNSKNGMIKGWINYNNQWYYTDLNGKMVKGLVTIRGSQYYFNSCGIKQTGWVNFGNGDWHYLRSDGTVSNDITPNHVTVGKSGCAYSSIQQAINSVPDCLITLVIHPGIYNEHVVLIGKNISLQGINKDTCIIQDNSGDYYNAPLSASGNGKISNLTFISTHNNANYTIPSYALHCDYAGTGTLTFTNCSFTSYQNSAVGIGMHQSQTIIFDDCDIRKNDSYNGGAFYCHNDVGNNVTDQHLIIKNSHITTNIGVAIRVDDASIFNYNKNSQMDIAFYNNTLSSDQKGISNNIVYFRDKPINDGISGQIELTKDSSGNNVSCLNASK